MTTAIAELDNLILLLEAQIPANPNSPKNLKQRERLERELRKYFRSLEQAFPYSKLAGIYNRNVKESLSSDTEDILDPLLASFDEKLTADIGGHLAETRISGTAEMVTWGQTQAGVPIAFEGPPIQGAIDWAGKHSATLVKGLDKETKKRLAHTISEGIKNKRGIPGLTRDIKGTFADMTKHRSELIARTETANALSEASLETMKGMGIDGKEWVTVGDDRVSEDCKGNEAEGVIPVGQAFSGGTNAPPQHPDCRCTVAPARLKK
ncbi:MAG: minor capsid protein [Deltaproteobacteria bacterium]|nr:minor capsid protein [Deltaproteobacteria bacterium]